MKTLISLFLVLALSGCATQTGLAVRDALQGRAQAAADETLKNLEYSLCRLPFETVVRHYGSSEELWFSYLILCRHGVKPALGAAPN